MDYSFQAWCRFHWNVLAVTRSRGRGQNLSGRSRLFTHCHLWAHFYDCPRGLHRHRSFKHADRYDE